MKITKFDHSCLLVEMPPPVSRTALFDPGTMSEALLNVDNLEFLDDIIITHKHADHFSLPLIKRLVAKFPQVRLTAPEEVVAILAKEGIKASSQPVDGLAFFESPHEDVEPLFPVPQEIGVHYLDRLSHPGDSHSFSETMPVLALPVTAPWGATIKAVKLALQLKPRYVIPIHDWHWRDEAREQMYDGLEQALRQHDISFIKIKNGEPVILDV